MQKFSILKPTATKNYIENPSFKLNTDGWIPAWTQEATFEENKITPSANKGYDSITGDTTAAAVAAIRGDFGAKHTTTGAGTDRGTITSGGIKIVTFEFFLDPNTLSMGENDSFIGTNIVTTGPARWGYVDFNWTAALGYRIRLSIRNDAAGDVFSAYVPITDEPHLIRLEAKTAANPGDNDGFLKLYVDGGLSATLENVDNDTLDLIELWPGFVQNVDATTTGSMYFDNVRWKSGVGLPFTGASIVTTKERARFGSTSLKVQTDGHSQNEGPYNRVSTLTKVDSLATASAYVRGAGEVRIRMKDDIHGSYQSRPIAIHDDFWQRIEVTGRVGANNDVHVYIETADEIQAVTFYVDGVQLELHEVATTYCDGDVEDCRWEGAFHASQSTRSADVASGGSWIDLNNEDDSIYITTFSGIGLPPITQNFQPTPAVAGGFFDNTRVNERTISLVIWTVNNLKDVAFCPPGEMSKIHALRQQIIDLVKPDFAPNSQPFILRYTENGRSFTIACRYEGGLVFDSDVRNIYTNTIPLRLLALDPFWEEDTQEVALLNTETQVAGMAFAGQRISGAWKKTGANGFNNNVFSIEEDPDGIIYFGGDFTLDGDGNQVRRFGSFNGDNTTVLERANGVNATVRDIKAHPNGKIYVCGDFTADAPGALSMNYIGEYDPATNTWSALGSGLSALGRRMAISPNGDVYVVGGFTTAGGNNANRIARWDGSSWHAVGDIVSDRSMTVPQPILYDIIIKEADEIFVCGEGTVGGTTEWMWSYNGTTWALITGASGTGGTVTSRTMALDVDGSVLVGKTSQLMRWNGSSLVTLGSTLLSSTGASSNIFAITVDNKTGLVYLGGNFIKTGTYIFPNQQAIWSGSSYSSIDVKLPGDAQFELTQSTQEIMVSSNGDIYLGVEDTAGAPTSVIGEGSGLTSVSVIASAESNPTVIFTGSGRIIWLENQTTGQIIFFDYTLQSDEILTANLNSKSFSVTSNYRGDVPNAILPNSDNMLLSPGGVGNPKENIIAVLMIDEVSPVVQIQYTPLHWSVDALG